MLKAALLGNVQTRPNVFGTRYVLPLPGTRVPLPTLPGIVGNTLYHPLNCMGPNCEKHKNEGNPARGLMPLMNPGTQFLQQRLSMGRMKAVSMPGNGISEPNMNNVSSP
jgi:hypothetical protein